MAFYFTLPNTVIFLSIIIYCIYDSIEKKQINDEREELIRLKALEFVQKANTVTLFLLSVAYFFTNRISGVVVIAILILASLYTEIGAKVYYRRKF